MLEINARRGSRVNEVLLNAEAHFLKFVPSMPGNAPENGFNCCYDAITSVKVIIHCYIRVTTLKRCNHSHHIVKIL
ncbi:hypothetical protein FTV90_20335 [Escherichia coli]|nr:hypothetical protein FTV90_20335 [Escherichia coli]